MKFVELVKPWTLDVRKMVRPERSGVLANLIVYALLWGWGYALIPHTFGGSFNLKCYLMPWMCPAPLEKIEQVYHIVPLYFGKGGHKKSKEMCSCRVYFSNRSFFSSVLARHDPFCGDYPMTPSIPYSLEDGGWITWTGEGERPYIFCDERVKESHV